MLQIRALVRRLFCLDWSAECVLGRCARGKGVGTCAVLAGNRRFWLPILLTMSRQAEEGHSLILRRWALILCNMGPGWDLRD